MKRILIWLTALSLALNFAGCSLPAADTTPAPQTEAAAPVTEAVSSDGEALTVHFIDVGQADCALLQCGGENMLIDGGNVADSQLVVSYLLESGVETLTYVVGTHAHEDHIGGLAGVLAVFPTTHVFCPVEEYTTECFADFKSYADQQGLELVRPEPGSVWELGGAEITVLGPVADYDDPNNTSIVLRVDYGETAFLFAGDAEAQAERDILDAGYDVSATVLKVGHHGSETSTCYRWLYEAAPQYGVISCGADNDYGHPHEEPLSRLKDAGVQLYRTDLQGHIICTSDGTQVRFSTEKETEATASAETEEAEETYYIGNIRSKVLHRPSCSGLPEAQNQYRFDDLKFALLLGYTPCSRCME